MSLTTVIRMQLEGKEFDELFEAHQGDWTAMAHTAQEVMTQHLGATTTLDDIKKMLHPMVEADGRLREHMIEHHAIGKRWIDYFTDYILHRVLQPTITPPAH